MKRALLAVACGLSFLAHSAQTHAQNAVTMIVNFSGGGSTDLMARTLQPEFAAALGTNMVIKNTSGANGTVGAMEMTRAARDGSTILMTPGGSLVLTPHTRGRHGAPSRSPTPARAARRISAPSRWSG